jgi:hypothetical protein
MRRLAFLASLCCACATVLAYVGVAGADVFESIKLESTRPLQAAEGMTSEQAESASESAVSGNGEYIAFVGRFAGVSGIWRRDVNTGTVEQVAPGEAKLPSISAEGRYVSFTTNARLAPEDDHNNAPDVYVRDMDKACATAGGTCLPCGEHQDAAEQEGCPFVLVSAVNGSSEGASYTYTDSEVDEEEHYGSLASGRSAISAKGNEVVFETAVDSDLLGAPTPAREILVRYLGAKETRLVSSEYDPQTNTDTGIPVPLVDGYGAAYPLPAFREAEFGGASISADGSTVAWLGQDIARQAKLLPGEQLDYLPEKNEPLWRQVEAGPSAPTLRVTGGSEPENPACAASGESEVPEFPSSLDPCHGPFAIFNHLAEFYLLDAADVNFVPQLSKNGDSVAFLASAREVGSGEEIAGADERDDLYVSQMADGVTRIQALRRLTEIAGEVGNAEFSAPIIDLAISPDGNQVAFTTQRTLFPLGSLSFVSTIAPKAGIKELFDVDLADDTIARVTHGYAGEAVPSEQANEALGIQADEGASSPSFTESNDTLSFSSSADNLVYGDGNGASDAFLVAREVFAESVPQQYISSPPSPPTLDPAWRLYATATPQPDGAVVLDVGVPSVGELAASASGAVAVTVGAARGARAKAHRAARAHTALLTRTVASAHASVPATTDGTQQLTLTLAPSYRALAQRPGGLYAQITLRFTSPGHPALSASLHVSFRRIAPASRSARSSRKRKGRVR